MRVGRVETFWFEGTRYSLVDKAVGLHHHEPLSSREACMVLQRMQHAHPRLIEDLSRAFGFVDGPDALLRELRSYESWTDGGLCRVELFRRSVVVPSIPRPIEPKPLAALAEDREVVPEHWMEVELHDREDNAIMGIPLEIVLPTGGRRHGKTNRFGVVRIEGIQRAGQCTVLLPEPDPSDVPAEPPPITGEVSLALVGADGAPFANLKLSIELADGSTRTVTTDAQGAVRVPDVRAGRCVISTIEVATKAGA